MCVEGEGEGGSQREGGEGDQVCMFDFEWLEAGIILNFSTDTIQQKIATGFQQLTPTEVLFLQELGVLQFLFCQSTVVPD